MSSDYYSKVLILVSPDGRFYREPRFSWIETYTLMRKPQAATRFETQAQAKEAAEKIAHHKKRKLKLRVAHLSEFMAKVWHVGCDGVIERVLVFEEKIDDTYYFKDRKEAVSQAIDNAERTIKEAVAERMRTQKEEIKARGRLLRLREEERAS